MQTVIIQNFICDIPFISVKALNSYLFSIYEMQISSMRHGILTQRKGTILLVSGPDGGI